MNSRCFVFANDNLRSRPRITKCLIPICEGQNLISIQYNSEILECQEPGQKVYPSSAVEQGFYLVCPDPRDFCSEFNNRCPNDCNARGICAANQRCICFYGATGADCSGNVWNSDIYHSLQLKQPQHRAASRAKQVHASSKQTAHKPSVLKMRP